MVGDGLLRPCLRPSRCCRLLLLQIELFELLVNLFGVQVGRVDLGHGPRSSAGENEALQLLLRLLFGVLLANILRRCWRSHHGLELLGELLGLDLVEEVAVLSLHAIHSLGIDSE